MTSLLGRVPATSRPSQGTSMIPGATATPHPIAFQPTAAHPEHASSPTGGIGTGSAAAQGAQSRARERSAPPTSPPRGGFPHAQSFSHVQPFASPSPSPPPCASYGGHAGHEGVSRLGRFCASTPQFAVQAGSPLGQEPEAALADRATARQGSPLAFCGPESLGQAPQAPFHLSHYSPAAAPPVARPADSMAPPAAPRDAEPAGASVPAGEPSHVEAAHAPEPLSPSSLPPLSIFPNHLPSSNSNTPGQQRGRHSISFVHLGTPGGHGSVPPGEALAAGPMSPSGSLSEHLPRTASLPVMVAGAMALPPGGMPQGIPVAIGGLGAAGRTRVTTVHNPSASHVSPHHPQPPSMFHLPPPPSPNGFQSQSEGGANPFVHAPGVVSPRAGPIPSPFLIETNGHGAGARIGVYHSQPHPQPEPHPLDKVLAGMGAGSSGGVPQQQRRADEHAAARGQHAVPTASPRPDHPGDAPLPLSASVPVGAAGGAGAAGHPSMPHEFRNLQRSATAAVDRYVPSLPQGVPGAQQRQGCEQHAEQEEEEEEGDDLMDHTVGSYHEAIHVPLPHPQQRQQPGGLSPVHPSLEGPGGLRGPVLMAGAGAGMGDDDTDQDEMFEDAVEQHDHHDQHHQHHQHEQHQHHGGLEDRARDAGAGAAYMAAAGAGHHAAHQHGGGVGLGVGVGVGAVGSGSYSGRGALILEEEEDEEEDEEDQQTMEDVEEGDDDDGGLFVDEEDEEEEDDDDEEDGWGATAFPFASSGGNPYSALLQPRYVCINCTRPFCGTACRFCGHPADEEVVPAAVLAAAVAAMAPPAPPQEQPQPQPAQQDPEQQAGAEAAGAAAAPGTLEQAGAQGGGAVQRCRDGVLLSYDDRCREHMEEAEPGMASDDPAAHQGRSHPERPERVAAIMVRLLRSGLLERCERTRGREATLAELLAVHDPKLVAALEEAAQLVARSVEGESEGGDGCGAAPAFPPPMPRSRHILDCYFNPSTAACARLAAGSAADVAVRVATGAARCGAAIIRPPGHHAESSVAMGFCYYNNAAVAARAAQAAGARRVVVMDWDVHHGNGTQRIFYDDPSVLYMSTHRYDHGTFYPGTGDATEVGSSGAAGATVNVAWNGPGVRDADMLAAFRHVIVPIAREFAPDLLIVSAGFDAVEGDPLGGCRITPGAYGHFTRMLAEVAPTVLLLEGGYNLTATAAATEACMRVLLGEAPPPLEGGAAVAAAAAAGVAVYAEPAGSGGGSGGDGGMCGGGGGGGCGGGLTVTGAGAELMEGVSGSAVDSIRLALRVQSQFWSCARQQRAVVDAAVVARQEREARERQLVPQGVPQPHAVAWGWHVQNAAPSSMAPSPAAPSHSQPQAEPGPSPSHSHHGPEFATVIARQTASMPNGYACNGGGDRGEEVHSRACAEQQPHQPHDAAAAAHSGGEHAHGTAGDRGGEHGHAHDGAESREVPSHPGGDLCDQLVGEYGMPAHEHLHGHVHGHGHHGSEDARRMDVSAGGLWSGNTTGMDYIGSMHQHYAAEGGAEGQERAYLGGHAGGAQGGSMDLGQKDGEDMVMGA